MGKFLRQRVFGGVLALVLAVVLACGASAGKKAKESAPLRADDYFGLTPMTVVIVQGEWESCRPNCPRWIAADGDIADSTPAQFRKVLKQAGKQKLPVLINSPGGSVEAALAVGRMLRKAGVPVAVAGTSYVGCAPAEKSCKLPAERKGIYRGRAATWTGYCASACPLILAGGVSRLADPGTIVGVHEFHNVLERERIRYRETYRIENGRKKVLSRKVVSRKRTRSDNYGISKEMHRKLARYLAEMGVSPALVDEMKKAPYSSINVLPAGRLLALKLVTAERGTEDLVGTRACMDNKAAANCTAVVTPPSSLQEMAVRLVRYSGGCEPNCPEWIAADGPITRNTPDRFRAVLAAADGHKLPVVLNSRGGDFEAALEIGGMIRAAGLTTAIAVTRVLSCEGKDGNCTTAASVQAPFIGLMQPFGVCDHECLYVLAGGVARYHALMAEGDFAPPGKRTEKRFETARAYLAGMGVSPAVLEDAAAVISGLPLHLLRPRLLAYGFGTRTASPDFLADQFSCKGSDAMPNCVLRDARTARQAENGSATPPETAAATPPKAAAGKPAKKAAPPAPAKKRHGKPRPRKVITNG